MNKFTYNAFNEIEFPTIVLSSVVHEHYGIIDNVDKNSFSVNFNMNSAQEISFDVYKEVDGKKCKWWDNIVDLKYVYIPEHKEYYKISVTIDEDNKTVKHITGTSASEYELSNKRISIEVNTEYDLLEDETLTEAPYTFFYVPEDTEISLLHRVLKDKCPDWSIKHVDDTLWGIGGTYSISNQDVYSILTSTIAKEANCLFQFDSVNRTISVYDLLNKCENPDCGYRGLFTDECTKCGSKLITYGYGNNTGIYISSENYSEKMTVDGDENNVKNCFKVSGADDNMNAAIVNTNPSGSEYLYRFSEADYNDMPTELSKKLRQYNDLYHNRDTQKNYQDIVYNYYESWDKYYFYKTNMMPRAGCTHWRSNTNYSAGDRIYLRTLSSFYYLQCIQSGKTGSEEPDGINLILDDTLVDGTTKWKVCPITALDTASAYQYYNDIVSYFSTNPVYFLSSFPASIATANRYVKDLALINISPLFRVEILDEDNSWRDSGADKIWSGKITVTNTSDTDDKYTGSLTATLKINTSDEDYRNYMLQLVNKRIDRRDTTFTSIYEIEDDNEFKKVLQEYSLDALQGFAQSYSDCLNVLIENGITSPTSDFYGVNLYDGVYAPYNQRMSYIDDELATREATVRYYYNDPEDDGSEDITEEIKSKYYTITSNTNYNEPGLVQKYRDKMLKIQSDLDLKTYLGDELWLQLFPYIRESDYTNQNYSSEGLTNAELLHNAQELVDKATIELEKASELQYSLSDNLKNLLNTKDFRDFKDNFEIGDYIMCRVDEVLYKLRLISVSYQYSTPDSLSVTFSNVTKIKNYFSDVQNVLSQANSMASSYQMIASQVERNKVATNTVRGWTFNGLSSTLVNIMNNDKEEVTMDNTGINVKSYNNNYYDEDNPYSSEQLRITSNILAFTKDNWKTASLGLGKQKYQYFDDGKLVKTYENGELVEPTYSFVQDEDYGIHAKFMDAGFIHGSQIIAGDIYSENYACEIENGKPKTTFGSHIGLSDGSVELGGGALSAIYNATKNAYEVSVTGDIIATGGKIGGWTITEHELRTTNSAGNYVVLADGSNDYQNILVVRTGSGNNIKYPFFVNADGTMVAEKAVITGAITATSLTLVGDAGQNVLGNYIAKDTAYGTPTSTTGGTGFQVSSAGLLTASNAVIRGTIYASAGSFTGTVTTTGNTFTTTISSDNMKIQNISDTNAFVSISAQSRYWNPYVGTANSGSITISSSKGTSVLTSRSLEVGAVDILSTGIILEGATAGDISVPKQPCLQLGRNYDSTTDTYSGAIVLRGNNTAIYNNGVDIFKFTSGNTFPCAYKGGGYITSSTTEVNFTYFLPKSANGRTVTCSNFTAKIRSASGGYIHGDADNMAAMTATATIVANGYVLYVYLKKTDGTAFPSGNNNTPVGVQVTGTFTFT